MPGRSAVQLWMAALAAILSFHPAHANDAAALEALQSEARRAAMRLLEQIRGEINRELEQTGPIRGITVCKYSAPEISASISRQTGMRVTRVSLRPRNRVLGEPDVWEQKHLLDFEKRLAKGEKVETLEASQVVSEPTGRYYRYLKAIPVGQACLACHGPVAGIPEGVKAQLAVDYPYDRAVNYQQGQVRGAVSVKKNLD